VRRDNDTRVNRKASFLPTVLGVLLLLRGAAAAQAPDTKAFLRRQISEVSQRLRFSDANGAEQYKNVKQQLTAQIQTIVDQYLTQGVDANKSDDKDIEKSLKELMGDEHDADDPEHYAPPFAQIGNVRGDRFLVVGYKLMRGGGAVNDSATSIRGYRVQNGHFEFIAATGQDFDGYGFFLKPLPSPPNESWFLSWGALSGFNGNRTRVRVYAFDGTSFRTVWDPADLYNVTVKLTKEGFALIHLDEDRYKRMLPPYFVQDDYIVVPDGVRLLSSQNAQ